VLRAEIEEWFADAVTSGHPQANDLLQRLRSGDDGQHLGAYFELWWYHEIRARGWTIIRKDTGAGLPDLIVRSTHGFEFVSEVCTFTEMRWEGKYRRRAEDFHHAIERHDPNFCFSSSIQSIPREVNLRSAAEYVVGRAKIEQQSQSSFAIDLRSVGIEGIVQCHTNWGITGPIHPPLGPPMGSLNQYARKMREILKAKAKKYRAIRRNDQLPYVIVLCTEHYLIRHTDEVMDAMFGTRGFSYDLRDPSSQVTDVRLHDGLVTPKPGLDWLPQNKSLGAVVFCRRFIDRNRFARQTKVLHNPFADERFRVPIDVFSGVPQYVESRRDTNCVYLGWTSD
jgi:hypothetical protein